MLCELRTDNHELTRFLRLAHEVCERYNDVATASLIEVWIDETERRTWFLAEVAGRNRSLDRHLATKVVGNDTIPTLTEEQHP